MNKIFTLFAFTFFLQAPAQSFQWAFSPVNTVTSTTPGTGIMGKAVVADLAGNSYHTGTFNGTAVFGSTTLAAPNFGNFSSTKVFLTKLDKAGNTLWAIQEATSSGVVRCIALDRSGNVYIAGNTSSGGIGFGTQSIAPVAPNTRLAYVARFDGGTGACTAIFKIVESQYELTEEIQGINFDRNNNFFLLDRDARSNYWQTINRKYDPSGNLIWSKTITGVYVAGPDYNYLQFVDTAGATYNALYATRFNSTPNTTIEGFTYPNAASTISNGLICKYNGDGTLAWHKYLPNFVIYNFTCDRQGNTYSWCYNYSSSAATIDGISFPGFGNQVVKIDKNGVCQWIRPQLYGQRARNVTVDHLGNIVVCGEFQSSINVGASTFTTTGNPDWDPFFARFDADLNMVASAKGTGIGADREPNMAVDGAGNLLFNGYMSHTASYSTTYGADAANYTGRHVLYFGSYADENGAFFGKWASGIPDAPGGLTVSGRVMQNGTLNWTDNSNNETGFRIYKGASESALTLLVSLPAGTTNYVDPNLSGATWYKVVAYNAAGESDGPVFRFSSILPVVLTRFWADVRANSVQLNWQTDAEANSLRFVVERSADGRQYAAIGELAAAGNSNSSRTYGYVDVQPLPGISFYRLRQEDADSRRQYSSVIGINRHGKAIQVFVSRRLLFLSLPATSGPAQLRVTNLAGQVLISRPLAAGSHKIDLPETAGPVLVTVVSEGQVLYAQQWLAR